MTEAGLWCERELGYRFENPDFLARALTHRSAGGKHNERLEFLGDAVLGLAAASFLSECFPSASEGELTKIRSRLVDETWLAAAGRRLGVAGHLMLGRGEEQSGGRAKPSILAGALEALAGAVFVDGGWEPARAFAVRVFPPPAEIDAAGSDAKTRLQEVCQQRFRDTPSYHLVERSGPPHRPVFTAAAHLGDRCLARGRGSTKKGAEQKAAEGALAAMEEG